MKYTKLVLYNSRKNRQKRSTTFIHKSNNLHTHSLSQIYISQKSLYAHTSSQIYTYITEKLTCTFIITDIHMSH